MFKLAINDVFLNVKERKSKAIRKPLGTLTDKVSFLLIPALLLKELLSSLINC